MNFLVRRLRILNLVLNLAFRRLNLIRFLMSTRLLHVLAELTTRPFLRPTVQRTFLAIRLPLRAHTILASTTICIILVGELQHNLALLKALR